MIAPRSSVDYDQLKEDVENELFQKWKESGFITPTKRTFYNTIKRNMDMWMAPGFPDEMLSEFDDLRQAFDIIGELAKRGKPDDKEEELPAMTLEDLSKHVRSVLEVIKDHEERITEIEDD